MKKSQQALLIMGLVGAPLVFSLFSAVIPQIGVVFLALILISTGAIAAAGPVLLVLLGAAIAPLILTRVDPTLHEFLFAVL